MNENPDVTPQPDYANAAAVPPPDIPLTTAAQQYLYQTRPWIRFMSVMLFIGSGLLVIMGALLIVMGLVTRISPFGPSRMGSLGPVENVIIGAVYLISSILYLAPGVFLSRCASAIKLLETNRSPQSLEDALRNQKSFWRYLGILTIICLILAAAFLVFSIFLAAVLMRR